MADIGIEIAQQMNDVFEQSSGQPDSPDLYWALAKLPEERSLFQHGEGWDGSVSAGKTSLAKSSSIISGLGSVRMGNRDDQRSKDVGLSL